MELNLGPHLAVPEGCSLLGAQGTSGQWIPGLPAGWHILQPGVLSPAPLFLPSLEVLRCENSGILSIRGCQEEDDL